MTSADFANLVAHAMLTTELGYSEAAQEFLTVQDTPERLTQALDFNREYEIAPWAFDEEN